MGGYAGKRRAIQALEQTETEVINSVVPGTGQAGKALVLDANGDVTMVRNFIPSSVTTAAAGADQAGATALTLDSNMITGADGAKGVKLPTAVAGLQVSILNTDASNALLVYPFLGDQINALGANNAMTVSAGQEIIFRCSTDSLWYAKAAVDMPGSVTATAAEVNYLDIATLGTGAASKAVVLDAGEDYTWPATGVLTYGVLKDPAATTITATGAEMNYLDIETLGTGAASKAVVLDAGEDYTWPATGVLTYGVLKDPAATTIVATGAEINRTCDVSTRIVDQTTATLTVTEAEHSGKTIVLDRADGIAVTLPAAAAGLKFRFIVKTTFSSAASIKSVSGADIMIGYALMGNDSDNTVVRWPVVAGDTADTIDLLGTANSTGGMAGQEIEIEGLAANLWYVKIVGDAAGTEATPFTNTVA